MANRTEMEIEKLLQWAYRDELSKRFTSAAEGIWDRLFEGAQLGIDRTRDKSAAQRYASIGLPDRDAETLAAAVEDLKDLAIDWRQSFDTVAGDLAGLVTVNDMTRRRGEPRERLPTVGWGKAGERALKAWWGPQGQGVYYPPQRDVLMVSGISTKMLVRSHAVKATRPDWREEPPTPSKIMAERGPNVKVIGECLGRNRYTSGSHCPIQWEPSPISILQTRADYLAWHHGLVMLAQTVELEKFIILPPSAPQLPWFYPEQKGRVIDVSTGEVFETLPLTPDRPRAGPRAPRKRASAVRSVDTSEIGA
jgi:hypothetical protein